MLPTAQALALLQYMVPALSNSALTAADVGNLTAAGFPELAANANVATSGPPLLLATVALKYMAYFGLVFVHNLFTVVRKHCPARARRRHLTRRGGGRRAWAALPSRRRRT